MSADTPQPLDYTTLRDKQVVTPPQVAGSLILIERDTTLPRRCVLCNADGIDPPLTLAARPQSPPKSFRITSGSLIRVKWYLCAYHHAHARILMIAGVTFLVLGVMAILALGPLARGIVQFIGVHIGNEAAAFGLVGGLFLIVGCTLLYLSQRSLRVATPAGPHLALAGACPAFLAELANANPPPPNP